MLVEKTDRLYRNLKDWAIIDDLDLEIHLVKENSIMSRDCRSSERFVHGIKVLMAKAYIDNLSEETRKGMLQKAQLGIWPTVAPIGYVNIADHSGRRIIAVDPDLGPLVTRLFAWFSTGDYSVKAVAARARSAGLCYRKSGKPVGTAKVHSILRHRIYTCAFEWLGEQYEGIHQPLTSPVLWEAVQRLLDQRSSSAGKKRVGGFPFHGLVECGHCGCALVAELKKGRYVYYHCTGYRQKCPEPYVRQERLEAHFAEALAQLDCGTSAFSNLQREVFHRYGDHLADERGEAARHRGGLQPIRIDTFADDGVALLNVARTAHRSLLALSVQLKHQLLEPLFARCSWANGELKTKFKRRFDRFHRFAVECTEGEHASHPSRALDRFVDDIIEPPVSIKLLIARYNAIARLHDDPDMLSDNPFPVVSAA